MKYFSIFVVALIMVVIWLTDAAKILGAHPWWSGKVVYIGAPIGIVMASITGLRVGPRWLVALFAAATMLAFWIAFVGKTGFAASFAEDRFAGRMWYFGWIATMAGLAGFIQALANAIFASAIRRSV